MDAMTKRATALTSPWASCEAKREPPGRGFGLRMASRVGVCRRVALVLWASLLAGCFGCSQPDVLPPQADTAATSAAMEPQPLQPPSAVPSQPPLGQTPFGQTPLGQTPLVAQRLPTVVDQPHAPAPSSVGGDPTTPTWESSFVAPASHVCEASVPHLAPRPPSYLGQGPAFNANHDPQSASGLAGQISQLQVQNAELANQIGKLQQDLEDVRRELKQTSDTAVRAQNAWEQGQQELAAARRSLEKNERQMDQGLERLRMHEDKYLVSLDKLSETLQGALRRHQEASREAIPSHTP